MFGSSHCSKILSALPGSRLLALDVFRGLTITAMVLVNNPGTWAYVYPPMLHATWHGWTPTDLIFPFFIFIMGISITIVMNRAIANTTDKSVLIKNALIRALKLFGLGLFLALFYFNFVDVNYSWIEAKLQTVRVMGVLQRLAIVFFFTVLIVLYFGRVGRAVWIGCLLLGYWGIMMLVPYTDDYGNVYQGLLQQGNSLTAWLDNYLLGANHVYYAKAVPFAFDPEGILSTLPAIAGALAGVFTGDLLSSAEVANSKSVTKASASQSLTHLLIKQSKIMLAWGLCLIVIGELFGLVFPINKTLWTSSFVVMTTGWALVTLAILTWLIDIKGWKNWSAPFVVFGANALLFFIFSGIVARVLLMIPVGKINLQAWIYVELYQPVFGSLNGSLAYAVSFLLLSYLVMHLLYKRKVFFKV
jgi:predicted acyltransferase